MRWHLALSWLAAVVGLGLLGWAARALGWRRWLDLDDQPAHVGRPRLVFSGPFRLVRHPQTLGLLCLLLAVALRWRTLGMTAIALGVALFIVWLVQRDEALLARRFGAAYLRYRQAVPSLPPIPR